MSLLIADNCINCGACLPECPENVRIAGLNFHMFQGAGVFPPRITINLSVGVNDADLQGNLTNIQTTVSARTL